MTVALAPGWTLPLAPTSAKGLAAAPALGSAVALAVSELCSFNALTITNPGRACVGAALDWRVAVGSKRANEKWLYSALTGSGKTTGQTTAQFFSTGRTFLAVDKLSVANDITSDFVESACGQLLRTRVIAARNHELARLSILRGWGFGVSWSILAVDNLSQHHVMQRQVDDHDV